MKRETCYYVYNDDQTIFQTTDEAKAKEAFESGKKVAELERTVLTEDGEDSVAIILTRVWKRVE